ncbi:MAG: LD-carboxypeptidase [Deltaproteobacteria bacterium]
MQTASDSLPLLAPPLKRGDTIGLVSPAGPVKDQKAFIAGLRILKDLGFAVKLGPEVEEGSGDYLAADDKTRAELFNRMWAAEETDAIMAVRGGYGSLRMADGIDLELIARRPKPFIGFSDITLLHSLFNHRTHLVTFHAPVLTSLALLPEEDIRHFGALLSGHLQNTIEPGSCETLRAKEVAGRLVGGNLATLTSLLGTPYEPDWRQCIVLLEDVGEAPYRIDRMLTQLRLAGKFAGIKGLILGSFTDCGNEELIWQRVLALTEDLGIAVWANFPAGHGKRNLTLPMGLKVRLLSNQGAILLEQPWLKEQR